VIATPSLADANNGNWRTAHRWQQLLEPQCQVKIVRTHENTAESTNDAAAFLREATAAFRPDIVIALHARRSHNAVVATKAHLPETSLIVALTGTDLYKDLAQSATVSRLAAESLASADALIVLQEDAIQFVPAQYRRKTHVVFQSARSLSPASKPQGVLNCVVVGHLRAEKSPQTIFESVRLLGRISDCDNIHITHIGEASGKAGHPFAEEARLLTASSRHYRWVSGLPHGLTRAAIKRSHLLIHPSILEGGANVIVEAITAGTPVIASRMSGNVGMLGADYSGYFPVGDAEALTALLRQCATNPNTLTRLGTACKARAKLFSPNEEKRRLLSIVAALLRLN
jgi:putative glycosyltransferase (TIGR04348 family)